MARIWSDIHGLARYIEHLRPEFRVTLTSGGFDCMHVGHVRLIREAAKLADALVVVVNGDSFLTRKKGYVFMPLHERLEIMAALSGVSHVCSWDDGTQFVDGAIRLLRPDFFARGGDRSTPVSIAPAEHVACAEVGCQIIYGVGGKDKVQSSQWLTRGKHDGASVGS